MFVSSIIKFYSIIIIACIVVAASVFVVPQTANAAADKKEKSKVLLRQESALKKLNRDIKRKKAEIRKLDIKEKSTIKHIGKSKKRRNILKSAISSIEHRIGGLQDSISQLDKKQSDLVLHRYMMHTDYAALCRKVWLEDEISDSELMLLPDSDDETFRASIYVEKLTGKLIKYVLQLNSVLTAVKDRKEYLSDISGQHADLMKNKATENTNLGRRIKGDKRNLKEIQKRKITAKRRLADQKRSAKKLKRIISDLIKKEIKKGGGKNQTYKTVPIGSIRWPVKSKRIQSPFGENTNPITRTVTDNPGIDISIQIGSVVKAAAKGKVSLVHWLAGYGTLVILNHGNGVRTVYANLSSVWVKKNDKVAKGKGIGKSGKTSDGEFLHFELWQGSTRLNPAHYLR
ncbi:MAG: peptidoglycan DD-metalloendopeptidase family protein [Candidatus Kapabacteria bacterium]|nr:peptidoglycan DD-metalloendopeptidase family protein [Candidatus Kapabacteria bacterium]